eukprot:TRINITY_DN6804_c0_g1_i12.p2 TRINITY_DN6804_c0_g1~~TRINITY_DN6804_c0_g1_i12.p2  ORF type:complete len:119 (-),score=24.65 TRINITY_DN6804_c0_g1_i12:188-544(-)
MCVIKGSVDYSDMKTMLEYCLNVIFRTEYKHHAVDYMIDLLKGNQQVLIKFYSEKKKYKQESPLEYIYRLSSLSSSRLVAESLDLVWGKEESNAGSWKREFKGSLLTGIINLLSVVSL